MKILLLAGLLLSGLGAKAQTTTVRTPDVVPRPEDGGGKGVDPQKVYDVVEQMPTLLTGGGGAGITAALRQVLTLPDDESDGGRVLVEFIVDRNGEVREAKVKRTTSPALGAAVLAAVKKLPRFKPGMQNG